MSRFSHAVIVGVFSGTIVLLSVVSSTSIAVLQAQDRIIEKRSFSNEPVKIIVVRTKNNVIEPGKKFTDGTDWFKGLRVIVENISDKPVTYIRVGVLFPRPGNLASSQGNPYGESLEYGVNPFRPEGAKVSNRVQAIAVGKSIELVMPDEAYSGTKALLEELEFPESIKRIELVVETVGFEDGTAWSGGELWHRDPSAPRGWSRVEKSQGSVRNHTAKFFEIGFPSSEANKATWAEPRPQGYRLPSAGKSVLSLLFNVGTQQVVASPAVTFMERLVLANE